ncbi:MAG: hypothetical protein AAFW46_12840 [Pseudomonadota bacterium]
MSARFVFALSVAAAMAATPLTADAQSDAQPYAEGSKANGWGLSGEQKALFKAKVVDILCTLSGDCADNCGEGTRQLGLIRADDDKLIPVLKNGQPLFNGAVVDLLPYCDQDVEVDGLLIGDDEALAGVKYYQVQRIRLVDGEWSKANLWSKKWNADHPEEAKQKGVWYRKDPLVKKHIERDGYLGLGPEVDKKFIEDNL